MKKEIFLIKYEKLHTQPSQINYTSCIIFLMQSNSFQHFLINLYKNLLFKKFNFSQKIYFDFVQTKPLLAN